MPRPEKKLSVDASVTVTPLDNGRQNVSILAKVADAGQSFWDVGMNYYDLPDDMWEILQVTITEELGITLPAHLELKEREFINLQRKICQFGTKLNDFAQAGVGQTSDERKAAHKKWKEERQKGKAKK